MYAILGPLGRILNTATDEPLDAPKYWLLTPEQLAVVGEDIGPKPYFIIDGALLTPSEATAARVAPMPPAVSQPLAIPTPAAVAPYLVTPLSPPVPESAPRMAARALLDTLNALKAQRVFEHAQQFTRFWDDPNATPDELLVEMGPMASVWLQCASESAESLARLAAFAGKTLEDFLPADKYVPRRSFVVTDGVLSLAPPADGYDAHGVLIPAPDPLIP